MYKTFNMGRLNILVFSIIIFVNGCAFSTTEKIKTANPDLSPSARHLLEFIYQVEDNNLVISGNHNYLGHMSLYSDSIFLLTGKYPALWGCDFGFSDSTHDIDNIKYRSNLIAEVIKQHNAGSIITFTYHQANPIIGEPCQFKGGVQSKLTDQEWQDLLTPGTEIYNLWKQQVDLFASYLKQLQNKNIPVLFRPYHEMTGQWFWWGGRPGENGFIALWKQLFDLYVNDHELNNLIWVWSMDRPWPGFEDYFPGHEYVDIIASDIYPLRDTNVVFRQEWYEKVVKLAGNKPLLIGECSVLPTWEEWENQPKWSSFMGWCDLTKKYNDANYLIELYNSEMVLTRDELPAFMSE